MLSDKRVKGILERLIAEDEEYAKAKDTVTYDASFKNIIRFIKAWRHREIWKRKCRKYYRCNV